MRIVVLVKPVPDPASAGERLGPDGRLDRAAVPAVVNGNDEYVLEAALKLVEASAVEGEITLLSMAPTNAPETLRKALAMGAHRGVHVTDPALAGSCAVSTAKVLAAALRTLEFDMVFAGVDASDGVGGIVPAAVAAHLGLPYLSSAAQDRARSLDPLASASGASARPGTTCWRRHSPLSSAGPRRSASPATPRSRGSWRPAARRSSRARWPISGWMPATVGGAVATTALLDSRQPPARGATEIVRGTPDEGAARIVDFLVERRII